MGRGQVNDFHGINKLVGCPNKLQLRKKGLINESDCPFVRAAQWTRVNLNWNWTNPCAGLCDVRQVPARPYPMQARFQC